MGLQTHFRRFLPGFSLNLSWLLQLYTYSVVAYSQKRAFESLKDQGKSKQVELLCPRPDHKSQAIVGKSDFD